MSDSAYIAALRQELEQVRRAGLTERVEAIEAELVRLGVHAGKPKETAESRAARRREKRG